jgi:hypothetical protein
LSEKDKTSLIKEDLIDEQQKVVTIKVAEKPEGEKENNVRFIKPRLLHREYDDEDESREVRMTKLEQEFHQLCFVLLHPIYGFQF